jgi:hypothetical protein
MTQILVINLKTHEFKLVDLCANNRLIQYDIVSDDAGGDIMIILTSSAAMGTHDLRVIRNGKIVSQPIICNKWSHSIGFAILNKRICVFLKAKMVIFALDETLQILETYADPKWCYCTIWEDTYDSKRISVVFEMEDVADLTYFRSVTKEEFSLKLFSENAQLFGKLPYTIRGREQQGGFSGQIRYIGLMNKQKSTYYYVTHDSYHFYGKIEGSDRTESRFIMKCFSWKNIDNPEDIKEHKRFEIRHDKKKTGYQRGYEETGIMINGFRKVSLVEKQKLKCFYDMNIGRSI